MFKSDKDADADEDDEDDDDQPHVVSQRTPYEGDVQGRIHKLCDMVVVFFCFPPIPLDAFPNFRKTFAAAKDELLTNLSDYAIRLDTFGQEIPKETAKEEAKETAKNMLEKMFMISGEDDNDQQLEQLQVIVRLCADMILEVGHDVGDVDDSNVSFFLNMVVSPFLKAAFLVKQSPPLAVEEKDEGGEGSQRSLDSPYHYSVRDGDSLPSPSPFKFSLDSPSRSGQSSDESDDENSQPVDTYIGFETPEKTQSLQRVLLSSQWKSPDPASINYFNVVVALRRDILSSDDTEIFGGLEEPNIRVIIDRICRLWNKHKTHDAGFEVVFIEDLVKASREGGSSRKKSSTRTRRKLRRNCRRNQHTNKHKRSSSKKAKHNTIKHRKSYRKHTHTIRRRKSRHNNRSRRK
jgi:hypothetical protein